MPLRKPNAANPPAALRAPAAPAPPPSAPAKAGGRLLLVATAALVAVGAAAWGAWSLWRPDPLREAREALDRRDFARAAQLLDARLAERDDARARLLAARAARRDKRLPTAQEHLRAYRERHGADADCELEESLLRAQGGDAAEADRAFAAHIDRPDSPDTALVMEAYLVGKLRALAPAAREHSRHRTPPPGVVADLRRAADLWLRLRPGRADQAQGRVWRARIALLAGELATAVAPTLREAVELDPDNAEARFQLALTLLDSRPDEAREHLERLLEREPDNAFLRYGLATTYRTLGRAADARRILEGLLAGPTELSALLELAALDMDERKLAAAEPRLRRVLDKAPNSPEANAAMSRFLQLSGRPAEAEAYRKRFDELDAERLKNSAPKH